MCFHLCVLFQLWTWTPTVELKGVSVIKAAVVTRSEVSAVSNLSQISGPVASLSPSSSRRVQAAKKAEAAQGGTPVQAALFGMQSNTTDSPSAESQAPGALSEIAPPTTDAVSPLPVAAVIEFSRRGFLGRTISATHLWHRVGDRYTLSVEGGATGGLAWFEATSSPLKSEGQLLSDELRPESFLGAESRSIHFDWAAGEARWGGAKVFVLQSDSQDPLSLAYQVMRLIRRGVTSVVVLDGQEARAYDLMLLAEETVELPAGQFPAWRVRIGLQSNPQVFTELWLGKEIYGMPIRIRESLADGSFRELVAERISVDGP